MTRRGVAVLLSLAVCLQAFPFQGAAAPPAPAATYTLHDAIEIIGDAGFNASNGVVSGSGTPEDPYIIEGWEINSSASNEIMVYNTNASVIFRNLWLHGPAPNAIYFLDVANATIEDVNTTARYSSSFYFEFLNNVTIRNSSVGQSPNWMGIRVQWSADVIITGNTVWASGEHGRGISVESSNRVMVADNVVTNGTTGITAGGSSLVTVADNRVEDQRTVGISAYQAPGLVVERNQVRPMDGPGLIMRNSTGAQVVDNVIATAGDDEAISVIDSGGAVLERNRLSVGGLYLAGNDRVDLDSHTIGLDNTLDGRPILYVAGCDSLSFNDPAYAQVILASCNTVNLNGFHASGVHHPVQVFYSTSVVVRSLHIEDAVDGVVFFHVVNFLLQDSRIDDASANGVLLDESHVGEFSRSRIASASGRAALRMVGVTNSTVSDNTLTSGGDGAFVSRSETLTFTGNRVQNNLATGVNLSTAHRSLFSGNAMINNTVDVLEFNTSNRWNDTYPIGGNFWDELVNGTDQCSGVLQDQCAGPDGFYDTSRLVSWDGTDYYPRTVPLTRPPVALMAVSPPNGTLGSTFTFDASASQGGPDGFDTLEYRWDFGDDGTFESNWSATPTITRSFDVLGDLPVTVEVKDTQGLVARATRFAIVEDLTHPTVSIFSPSEDALVTESPATVLVEAQDEGGAGVARVEVRAGGGAWVEGVLGPGGRWQAQVNLAVGPNVIEARSIDGSGNPSVTRARNIVHDHLPVVSVEIIPGGNETEVWVNFDGRATVDGDETTARLAFRWDFDGDGTWDMDWGDESQVRWDSAVLGNYNLSVEVRDSLGFTVLARKEYTVPLGPDDAAPRLQITPVGRPQPGAPIVFTVEATDGREVAKVEVVIEFETGAQQRIALMTQGDGIYVGQLENPPPGQVFRYYVEAVDAAGNLARSPANGTIRVAVPDAPAGGLLPGGGPALVLVAIAIGAVAAGLARASRGRARP